MTTPELTPAQERDLLLYGQFAPNWERGLVEAVIRWLHRQQAPGPEDIDHVDASWLPVLALTHRALSYTHIFGEEYERQAIKSAPWFHRWSGYWISIDQLAEDVEFTYTHAFIRGGTPERNTGINIYVTPTLIANLLDTDYTSYIVRTIPLLLPFFLGTINVYIALRLNWSLGVGGFVDHRAFTVIE